MFRGGTRTHLRSTSIRRMLRPTSHWPIATTQADPPRQTWRLMHPRMLPGVCLMVLHGHLQSFCENCVRMRGALSACGARSFRRSAGCCAGSPAARAGWPQDARSQQRSCMPPPSILRKGTFAKNRCGGGAGACFSLFFDFSFLNFSFWRVIILCGQDPAPLRPDPSA